MRNIDHERARVRRGRTLLGAAGLASIIGTGAFLASGPMAPERDSESAPPASRSVAQQAMSGAEVAAGAAARAQPMGPVAPDAAATDKPKSTAERLDDARNANKRMGTEVRRQRLREPSKADPGKVRTVENGTLKDNRRMMRIVSSRQDLTNFRELAWIADEGKPFRNARCSRTVQVSENVEPKEKPTMLMCWRLTPKKSVYTITVDLKKNPTPQEGVAALEREWKRMG
ncbi:hypothetical protein CLV67_112159 [Actinoplanes italicus]|uniref:Uncharacterized protein n=2 Tax=Actinoplanes italicus TaxID=113567 RepID=A0A2T0K789_9ACTN|nr:hypothetical protein CLV67_112159 [Actinoplanes italicus]